MALAEPGAESGSRAVIYKICDRADWAAAQAAGRYEGAPIDRADGYIHFSAADQVAETAAKHFAGQANLVLLAVAAAHLGAGLRWEPSRGGALFPHLYGPLPIAAVVAVHDLPLGPDGAHLFPGVALGAGLMDLTAAGLAALRLIDPERAHQLTVALLKRRGRRPPVPDDPCLRSTVLGLDFANPVGLAAGFDKDAEVMGAMLGFGFGFVEVGTITPRPQPGNPRPRVFRLAGDGAVINRYGFNSKGLDVAEANLRAFRDAGSPGLIGVNVGKNKETTDAGADYVQGVARLAPLADYLVANVSSPNTPGLRALQGKAELIWLVDAIRAALPGKAPPLLLKIAPDLAEEDLSDIAEIALDGALDGLIVSNTTIGRPPSLTGKHKAEAGGLSGRPLFAKSTAVLGAMYRLTDGRLPLIGVGGIASGADAYAKIRAGASLVQLYTALVYEGPGLVARIKRELIELLRRDGFQHISHAVGAGRVA